MSPLARTFVACTLLTVACWEDEPTKEPTAPPSDEDSGCGTPLSCYPDEDGDGHGAIAEATEACACPAGTATTSDDCDDTRPNAHPGAAEICNSADDDCDGEVDEDITGATYYADADRDGHGDADDPGSCLPSEAAVTDPDDCDDTDPDVYPGATEDCADGRDNDCSGLLDCEEESCAASAACAETDCHDGLDSDGDGRTDCEDDDCMASDCGTVRFTLRGGRMTGQAAFESYGTNETSAGCHGYSFAMHSSEFTGVAESVSGTVRAYSAGGALAESCGWFVGRAEMHHGRGGSRHWWSVEAGTIWVTTSSGSGYSTTTCERFTLSDEWSAPSTITREGVVISDGCSLDVEGLLPDRLEMNSEVRDRRIWQDELGAWYSGEEDSTSHWRAPLGTTYIAWTVNTLEEASRDVVGP